MPASPPVSSSPPATEWQEYKPVPSALELLDARFEAFVYEQSRLLGEVHRCLKGHEKQLQRQQKRLARLEERVDELLMLPLALGDREAKEGGKIGLERRIGRFRIVEGSGDAGSDAHIAGAALEDSGRVAAPQTHLPLTSKIPGPSWPDEKSDEEAWEASLGFGQATRNVDNADLRPQHEYRRSVSALAVNTMDTAQPSLVERSGAVASSGGPQDIDCKRSESEHSPALQVLPPSGEHLSMVEILDQLGEELMGFERERGGSRTQKRMGKAV